jgi:tripartite ATP-independent transporter DctM subunit
MIEMSVGAITLTVVVALLVLLATGFPVAFALLAIAVVGYILWIKPAALVALASVTFSAATTDFFIALPMFIFMAAILQVSGMGTALYDMMHKWMAGIRGGLAMGTVAISTVIAAMTGAAATATVSMGMIAYPEMRDRGYSKTMAIGCIPAGGCLGPLIPPSIPMILVAALSSISIGKLFISGVLPGLLTSLFFITYIGVRCFRNPSLGPPLPSTERASWPEKFVALRGAILPIFLIFVVLGLIYLGIATPSEAGGVGAFGALVVAAIYRNLNWRNIKNASMTALRVNAMVFMLIIAGLTFSSLLGITGVTRFIGEVLTSISANRWVVLAVMLAIVYVMGMFIDATPITVITIPIFIPIVRELGFDPLWFGLIFTMDLLIGFITPPFGINMFFFKGLNHPGVTMADIYRSCLPYVMLMTLAWFLCILFPQIPLILPGMMK